MSAFQFKRFIASAASTFLVAPNYQQNILARKSLVPVGSCGSSEQEAKLAGSAGKRPGRARQDPGIQLERNRSSEPDVSKKVKPLRTHRCFLRSLNSPEVLGWERVVQEDPGFEDAI